MRGMKVKSILMAFSLMLAGLAWAAQANCGQQEPATDAKDESVRSSSDSSDSNREIKTGRLKDAGDLQQVYTSAGFGRGFKGLTSDFLGDQRQIWTSPARLRFSDTEWLVPVGGITARAFRSHAALHQPPVPDPLPDSQLPPP